MRLEGATAFMDPSEYRTAMYHVFWKGEAPPKKERKQPVRSGRRTRRTPSVHTPLPHGALDALRNLNQQIAEKKQAAE